MTDKYDIALRTSKRRHGPTRKARAVYALATWHLPGIIFIKKNLRAEKLAHLAELSPHNQLKARPLLRDCAHLDVDQISCQSAVSNEVFGNIGWDPR